MLGPGFNPQYLNTKQKHTQLRTPGFTLPSLVTNCTLRFSFLEPEQPYQLTENRWYIVTHWAWKHLQPCPAKSPTGSQQSCKVSNSPEKQHPVKSYRGSLCGNTKVPIPYWSVLHILNSQHCSWNSRANDNNQHLRGQSHHKAEAHDILTLKTMGNKMWMIEASKFASNSIETNRKSSLKTIITTAKNLDTHISSIIQQI